MIRISFYVTAHNGKEFCKNYKCRTMAKAFEWMDKMEARTNREDVLEKEFELSADTHLYIDNFEYLGDDEHLTYQGKEYTYFLTLDSRVPDDMSVWFTADDGNDYFIA